MRAAALALLLLLPAEAQAQSRWTDEVRVGSDRELYLRTLALLGDSMVHRTHPWSRSLDAASTAAVRMQRPLLFTSFNQAFPWPPASSPSGWQGKGLNTLAALGVAADFWRFSARLEPVFSYVSNSAFELENPGIAFRDAMRPAAIDLPQRFGEAPITEINPGESYVRLRALGMALALSHERVFWGPGVRHSLLFSAGAPRFPHVEFSTDGPRSTPLGVWDARLIYSRLEQSDYAPPAPSSRRFGSGIRVSWQPPAIPLGVGIARFYHRAWPPGGITSRDLLAPFGSLLFDDQFFSGGPEDNQLATVFFSLRLQRVRTEVFGEFGRNDRSVDSRDLALEAEHNSAWLLGFLSAFALDSARASFWSVRLEAASGRVSAIQSIRPQATFYEHTPIRQGHTHRGQLLGTPLVDRSGGSELALDRWDSRGRLGIVLFQRQMPRDYTVGMARSTARTQWDVRVGGVRFIGRSEISLQVGHVWDVNRYPGRSAGNAYVAAAWRQGLPW